MVEYRDVVGFPGYRVGDDGSVWSRHTSMGITRRYWLRMRERKDKSGYLRVCLKRNKKGYYRPIAHLVLEAFVGPRPEGAMSLHSPDPTPTNNTPGNLRWGTVQDNANDTVAMGNTARGEKNGFAKLTTAQVVEMRRDFEAGAKLVDLAVKFGVSRPNVSRIVNRSRWKHV